ncbi:MAG: hypothetical protein AAF483_17245, partial [Planctomycetota bacterium]
MPESTGVFVSARHSAAGMPPTEHRPDAHLRACAPLAPEGLRQLRLKLDDAWEWWRQKICSGASLPPQ